VAPPEVARIGKMMAGTIDEARDPTSPITIPQDFRARRGPDAAAPGRPAGDGGGRRVAGTFRSRRC
jgi:hypothetical protein